MIICVIALVWLLYNIHCTLILNKLFIEYIIYNICIVYCIHLVYISNHIDKFFLLLNNKQILICEKICT